MLRITAYADRLADELALVDWPESIKVMQRNWIGRSEGAVIDFPVDGHDQSISVFTTRPDTLFGATYMVLSPEHPLVDQIATAEHRAAVRGLSGSGRERRSDTARAAQAKTGVFTGAHAINPASGERIPIWIADYVLMGYGTGAIMAVPAHDQRDFDFAVALGLPVRAVVMPDDAWLARRAPSDAPDEPPSDTQADGDRDPRRRFQDAPVAFGEAFEGEGVAINSAGAEVSIDALPTPEAKQTIIAWLEAAGFGRAAGAVQAPRLALQPAALLGRAVPDPARARWRDPSGGRGGSAGGAARDAGLPSRRQRRSRCPAAPAAGPRARVMALRGDRRRPLRARAEHDAPVGGLVLVLLAVSRSRQRRTVRGPRGRAVLDVARSAFAAAGTPRPAWTCTWAGPSTRCCISSTRGSGTRCSTTWGT